MPRRNPQPGQNELLLPVVLEFLESALGRSHETSINPGAICVEHIRDQLLERGWRPGVGPSFRSAFSYDDTWNPMWLRNTDRSVQIRVSSQHRELPSLQMWQIQVMIFWPEECSFWLQDPTSSFESDYGVPLLPGKCVFQLVVSPWLYQFMCPAACELNVMKCLFQQNSPNQSLQRDLLRDLFSFLGKERCAQAWDPDEIWKILELD